MIRRYLSLLGAGLLIAVTTGAAKAALTTIGTVTYNGSDYKLIWEDNNNGNSLIWLDYSNDQDRQYNQESWSAGLDGVLTYHINPTYTVTWDDTAWRLPSTVDTDSSYGYNSTSSEMGYLYYTELGNLGEYDTSGNPQSGYGLTNTGDFDHLVTGDCYWSGTHMSYPSYWVWLFDMSTGFQNTQGIVYGYGDIDHYALAVRGGEVSTASTVPVPQSATLLLLGIGMVGLAGLWRQRKANYI